MACCYSRSMLMAMYPDTEGCKCCHVKRRRDRVLRKKGPAEVVTTNTSPLPTENVDELVSLIEGTSIGKAEGSDPKKVAKKARQKERKKLEEEVKRKALEEEERQLEIEQMRAQELAHEQDMQKKREKKKRQRQNKKADKTKSPPNDVKATNVATASFGSEQNISVISDIVNNTGQPSSSTCKSEMVTIRRHSTAPDTTVTISVKSEAGDEDLLYTLVNGQVYPKSKTEKAKAPGEARKGPNAQTPAMSKGQGKNKKKGNCSNDMKKIVGKENGHSMLDPTIPTYEGSWFGAGTEMSGSTTQGHLAPGVSAYLSPIVQNGPSLPTPPLAQATVTNEPGNKFSFFSVSEGNEIDLTMLKLPPGITITKVNQPVSGQASELVDHLMPPPGAALYDVETNMIVMNPNNLVKDDVYNIDECFFQGIPIPPEYKTVLSQKEKRKRKATRYDDREFNGSNERGTPHSREGTPGATGPTSSGRAGKIVPDFGSKSSGFGRSERPKSKSVSGTSGTVGKLEGKKTPDARNRQSRPGQYSTPLRVPESNGNVWAGNAQGEHSRPNYPSSLTPPVSSQSASVTPKAPPRPRSAISSMTSLKMADVVSGAHFRVSPGPNVFEPPTLMNFGNEEITSNSFISRPEIPLVPGDNVQTDVADYNRWISKGSSEVNLLTVGRPASEESVAFDVESEVSNGSQDIGWQQPLTSVWDHEFLPSNLVGHTSEASISLQKHNISCGGPISISTHITEKYWNEELLVGAPSGYETQSSPSESLGVPGVKSDCLHQIPRAGTSSSLTFDQTHSFSRLAAHEFDDLEFSRREKKRDDKLLELARRKEQEEDLTEYVEMSKLIASFKCATETVEWSLNQDQFLTSQLNEEQSTLCPSSVVQRQSPTTFEGGKAATDVNELGTCSLTRKNVIGKPQVDMEPFSTQVEFMEDIRGHERLLRMCGVSETTKGPIPRPFIDLAGGLFFSESTSLTQNYCQNVQKPTEEQQFHTTGSFIHSSPSEQEHRHHRTEPRQTLYALNESGSGHIPYLTSPARRPLHLDQHPTLQPPPSTSSGPLYALF